MPDAPTSSVFVRYVLENPWPVGGLLLALSLAIGWIGLREGLRGRTRLALALAFCGLAVIGSGLAVVTPGERARVLTEEVVDAVVNQDVIGAMALFAADATMHASSPTNPGFDREFIEQRLVRLAERYTIESNTITSIRAATLSSLEGEVRFGCLTTVESFPYPTATQWILRARRDVDGSWRISRLTFVAINNQTPSIERVW